MGIRLEEKKKNVFKVEVTYSTLGEFIGSGGVDDDLGTTFEKEFEANDFNENVLPYLELMVKYSGGINIPKEEKQPVINMNISDDVYTEVWDKISEAGLIEYGVEYLEEIEIDYVDGNGVAYNVILNAK